MDDFRWTSALVAVTVGLAAGAGACEAARACSFILVPQTGRETFAFEGIHGGFLGFGATAEAERWSSDATWDLDADVITFSDGTVLVLH
jgi:hypothetical protein